jgi:hypothetical protein
MTNNYFVYVYFRDDEPFYVGLGQNDRDMSHWYHVTHRKSRLKNDHFHNVLVKLREAGAAPKIERVAIDLDVEQAKRLEIELIAKYGRADLGRGSLTNQTDGGDGTRGWSLAAREAQAARRRGKVSVVDGLGNKFLVLKDDPRLASGELRGQNAGITFDSVKMKGLIQARTADGTALRVRRNDPRWVTGELVGIKKDTTQTNAVKSKISATLTGKPNPKPANFGATMRKVALTREAKKRAQVSSG